MNSASLYLIMRKEAQDK